MTSKSHDLICHLNFLNENKGRDYPSDTLFHAQTELLLNPAALGPNREEEEKKRKGRSITL